MKPGSQRQVELRCPRCLVREGIDMDMPLFDKDRMNTIVLRCSFCRCCAKKKGQRLNAQFREKYRDRMIRITDFLDSRILGAI